MKVLKRSPIHKLSLLCFVTFQHANKFTLYTSEWKPLRLWMLYKYIKVFAKL